MHCSFTFQLITAFDCPRTIWQRNGIVFALGVEGLRTGDLLFLSWKKTPQQGYLEVFQTAQGPDDFPARVCNPLSEVPQKRQEVHFLLTPGEGNKGKWPPDFTKMVSSDPRWERVN